MGELLNADALIEAYQQVEEGEPRMRAIRDALTQAEQAQDFSMQLVFHNDFIRDSVFSGDRYQALIDFPRFYAIFQEHEELQARFRHDVLWEFKWILQAATEFPQIPKVQIFRWFSEFQREMEKAGYSLKPFYSLRMQFYSYFSRAKLRLDYAKYQAAARDSMSDGIADHYDNTVQWELYLGNRERAQKAFDYILRENLHSEECPAKPYGYFLADAMRRGDRQAAADCADPLRQLCMGKRFRMEQIGLLLCYDAWNDAEAGWKYLQDHMEIRASSRNPFLCFWFDRGKQMLCEVLARRGKTMTDRFGNAVSPQELAKIAEDTRKSNLETAARFDARNESDYFTAAAAEFEQLIQETA